MDWCAAGQDTLTWFAEQGNGTQLSLEGGEFLQGSTNAGSYEELTPMELPPWEEYKDLPWPLFVFVTGHVILQNVVVLLLVLPA